MTHKCQEIPDEISLTHLINVINPNQPKFFESVNRLEREADCGINKLKQTRARSCALT